MFSIATGQPAPAKPAFAVQLVADGPIASFAGLRKVMREGQRRLCRLQATVSGPASYSTATRIVAVSPSIRTSSASYRGGAP